MNSSGYDNHRIVTRRTFLKAAAATLTVPTLTNFPENLSLGSEGEPSIIRFGIVTDSHYANADTIGTRYYRHSLKKMAECVKVMNKEKVDFLAELGDFKDENVPSFEDKTLVYLREIEAVFSKFKNPRYHVLGNHDMDSISKQQFLENIKNTGIEEDKKYYSFNKKGVHFIVLDANYNSDGTDYNRGNFDWTDANIPQAELDWLRADLDAANGNVIVMIHQLLDGSGTEYVKNAVDIRQILEQSGKVIAVLQGHFHQGSYSLIKGIHYYTLKAMVEGPGPQNNSYAIVEIHSDLSITITGYRNAVSKDSLK